MTTDIFYVFVVALAFAAFRAAWRVMR